MSTLICFLYLCGFRVYLQSIDDIVRAERSPAQMVRHSELHRKIKEIHKLYCLRGNSVLWFVVRTFGVPDSLLF
jgi:hypothetical protein